MQSEQPKHKYQVTLFLKAECQIRANSEDEIREHLEKFLSPRLNGNSEFIFLETDFSLPIEHLAHTFITRIDVGEIVQTG